MGGHGSVLHCLGRRSGDAGLGQQQGVEAGVGSGAMGIAQHGRVIDQAHHRATRTEIFGDAEGMAELLLAHPQQTCAAADDADAGERTGGMVFGRCCHQRGAGP
ncbi:hypothetical protein D3C81_1197690 [compost metagenome]